MHSASRRPPSTTYSHTQLSLSLKHTELSLPHTHSSLTHNLLTHTTLSHTHNLLTHDSRTHNSLTHNSLTQLPHTHTTLSHTTHSHNSLTHTQLTHTQLRGCLCGRRGTWRHPVSFGVAGVALMALGWLWRAWFPFDALVAAAVCVIGVALGDIQCHLAW